MYKSIYLKRGKEESLLRFHPWVFSGAIHHADAGIQEGETVRVIASTGDFIAVGHYQVCCRSAILPSTNRFGVSALRLP